jgi:hypothetical protein
MVNSDELLNTTKYLTLYTWCRINRCRYNRARLYFLPVTLHIISVIEINQPTRCINLPYLLSVV